MSASHQLPFCAPSRNRIARTDDKRLAAGRLERGNHVLQQLSAHVAMSVIFAPARWQSIRRCSVPTSPPLSYRRPEFATVNMSVLFSAIGSSSSLRLVQVAHYYQRQCFAQKSPPFTHRAYTLTYKACSPQKSHQNPFHLVRPRKGPLESPSLWRRVAAEVGLAGGGHLWVSLRCPQVRALLSIAGKPGVRPESPVAILVPAKANPRLPRIQTRRQPLQCTTQV